MTDFVPGDIVALVSGGPPMTVRALTGPWVIVNWFSGTEVREGMFVPSQLFLIDMDGEEIPDGEPASRLN